MTDWLIAVIIGVALGLLLGIKIARDSNHKQPILGGVLAQVFHYLACSGLTAMLPFILAGIIVGLPFLALFGTALGFLALTATCMLLYAAFERPQAASAA
jgi:hypothetical protein